MSLKACWSDCMVVQIYIKLHWILRKIKKKNPFLREIVCCMFQVVGKNVYCVACSRCIIFLWPGPTIGLLDCCQNHAHCHVIWYNAGAPHILWYNTYWTHSWALCQRHRCGGYRITPANCWFPVLPFWGNVDTLQHSFLPQSHMFSKLAKKI